MRTLVGFFIILASALAQNGVIGARAGGGGLTFSSFGTDGMIPFRSGAGAVVGNSGLLYNSAGARLSVGALSWSGILSTFSAQRAITGDSIFHDVYRDESTFTSTTTGALASFDAQPTITGSTNYNHNNGFQDRTILSGSGSMGSKVSFYGQPVVIGQTVTNMAGLSLPTPTIISGSIANYIGVSIGAAPATTTSAYAIYSFSSAPSVFLGNIQSLGTLQGTALTLTTGGFTSYGGLIANDASGGLLANPNLSIINGTLTMANGATSKVLASASSSLQLEATSGTVLIRPSAGTVATFSSTAQTNTVPLIATTVQVKTLYVVSGLPTCNAGAEGTRAAVTDLLTPTFMAAAVGGGAVRGAAYCNGTSWISN